MGKINDTNLWKIGKNKCFNLTRNDATKKKKKRNETKKLIKSENKARYIYLYILLRLLIRVPAFVEAFIWKAYKTRCEKVYKILINVQLEFYIETIEDIHRSLINIYHAHPCDLFIRKWYVSHDALRIYHLLKFHPSGVN